MESWRQMTADYCRRHRGEMILTCDVAAYMEVRSTREYIHRHYIQVANKYLRQLEDADRIERAGKSKNVGRWRIPEGFERWSDPKTSRGRRSS